MSTGNINQPKLATSMKHTMFLFLVLMTAQTVVAQESTDPPPRKNTIKLDITSSMWYRNAIGLSYERMVSANQSFVVSAGYQEFPRTRRLGEHIEVNNDRSRSGYKFGGEYRYYLRKENKYPAPRGLYVGPYFTRHSFDNERSITVDNEGVSEQAILTSAFRVLNMGFQIGYQFVLKDRWTLDIVFIGPSFSHYRYKLALEGDYTFDKDDIQNEVILDLLDRFPLLDEVISEKEATRSGLLDTWSYGYRYQFQIGYRFGKKE